MSGLLDWGLVGFAFFLDLGSYFGGYNRRSDYSQYYPSTSPS